MNGDDNMKRSLISIVIIGIVGLCSTAWGQTMVCGDILTETWNVDGSPYVVQCSSTVLSGETLTIEPGVEVILGEDCWLEADGQIIADLLRSIIGPLELLWIDEMKLSLQVVRV